jgi:hypothetical protein
LSRQIQQTKPFFTCKQSVQNQNLLKLKPFEASDFLIVLILPRAAALCHKPKDNLYCSTVFIMNAGPPSMSLSITQDMSSKPKRYRPKASSLPTSLVRTILLNNDNESNEKSGENSSRGTPTEIIVQLFSDRIFLSITQLNGKMGSLLVCNVEESVIDNSTTYNVRTLLGTGIARGAGMNADQEIAIREVYVRRIAEKIVLHARRMAGVGENCILGGEEDGSGPIPPLVVGLGLRPQSSRGHFNQIVDAAFELYEEGWKMRNSGSLVGMEGPD